MLHAIIIGAGLQGSAIAYALSKLGILVDLVDVSSERMSSTVSKINSLGGIMGGQYKTLQEVPNIEKVDIVVSAAPYEQNCQIFDFCCSLNLRYCDLGGNPEVSNYINNKAKNSTFTDLGLAPGLANILAEHIFQKHGVDSISICVGGLPCNPTGYLNYGRTFNICGLRNEYTGPDLIIQNGEVVSITALDGIEPLVFCNELYEVFHTKGGLGLSVPRLKAAGLKNYTYKTIRYPGHAAALCFLLNECKLPADQFDEAIKNACPEILDDKVLISIQFNGDKREYIILHNENWTAMQIGTAFPTAAVAALMAEGEFDEKHASLNYGDVPFCKFTAKLAEIGGMPIFKE